MLALVGFAVGYYVGCNSGKEGLEKLINSFGSVQKSDEFAAMVDTARQILGQAAKQAMEMGTGVVAGEVKGVVNRRLRVA
jgi:hypothetical protein